jgi:hypothetical protein
MLSTFLRSDVNIKRLLLRLLGRKSTEEPVIPCMYDPGAYISRMKELVNSLNSTGRRRIKK